MSGGAFDYVYYKSADEWLTNYSAVENFEGLLEQLKTYGEPAAKAVADTTAFLEKLKASRDAIEKMEEELTKLQEPLVQVMKSTEYHASYDYSMLDVLKELDKYNGTKEVKA